MLRYRLFYSGAPRYTFFFFFNDTATTEIYTLSLHDALPISFSTIIFKAHLRSVACGKTKIRRRFTYFGLRSEEHTSELQSRLHLVCRLLLEKKKTAIRWASGLCPASPER